MQKPRWNRVIWSAVLTAVIASAVTYVAYPIVRQRQHLANLSSVDEQKRGEALRYLQANSQNRPLMSRVARLIESLDATHAIDVYTALSAVDAQKHIQLRDAMFERLEREDDAMLEHFSAILDQQGKWGVSFVPLDAYVRWIGMQANDSNHQSRILATIELADLFDYAESPLLAPLLEKLITDEHPDVRMAALVAAGELAGSPQAGPQQSEYEHIIALATDDAEPLIARDAWLILGLLDPSTGYEMRWREAPPLVTQAMLFAALYTNPNAQAPVVAARDDESADPLVRATAEYVLRMHEPRDRMHPMSLLTTFEELQPYFASDEPLIRDVTVHYVVIYLRDAPVEQWIVALLNDYNDMAKLSGAMLAGMLKMHPMAAVAGEGRTDLLEYRAAVEDEWSVRQMLRMGLWMQGRQPAIDREIHSMLSMPQLPRSTILLAMLHQGDPMALDMLFNPRGNEDEAIALRQWLGEYRWWYVLDHYLPDDAPPFWVDGSDWLQQFQIDILRNWWLVNRHRRNSRDRPPTDVP